MTRCRGQERHQWWPRFLSWCALALALPTLTRSIYYIFNETFSNTMIIMSSWQLRGYIIHTKKVSFIQFSEKNSHIISRQISEGSSHVRERKTTHRPNHDCKEKGKALSQPQRKRQHTNSPRKCGAAPACSLLLIDPFAPQARFLARPWLHPRRRRLPPRIRRRHRRRRGLRGSGSLARISLSTRLSAGVKVWAFSSSSCLILWFSSFFFCKLIASSGRNSAFLK